MKTINPSTLVALLEKELAWASKNSEQDLEETVKAGLNWQTDYWNDCALNWIEQGYPLNNELVAILEEISKNKNKSQRTRHRAFAFSKRWKKNENT